MLLARLPKALARSDWRLHAYALMSNHIHLAMTAGQAPAARFLKPLLVSVARRLNDAQDRFGPVFGDRATTVVMAPERAAALCAYIHNNPVRAGLVDDPAETNWTSHRSWVGLEPAPAWLAVDGGLAAAGYGGHSEGRRAFHQYVCEHSGDPRDRALSGAGLARARQQVRAATALPVEVGAFDLRPIAGGTIDVLHVGHPPVAPRWNGQLAELVALVGRRRAVVVDAICSRTHQRAAVEARRLVMVTGAWFLRRPVNELAAALTISVPVASRLLHRAERVLDEARDVAQEVRRATVDPSPSPADCNDYN